MLCMHCHIDPVYTGQSPAADDKFVCISLVCTVMLVHALLGNAMLVIASVHVQALGRAGASFVHYQTLNIDLNPLSAYWLAKHPSDLVSGSCKAISATSSTHAVLLNQCASI